MTDGPDKAQASASGRSPGAEKRGRELAEALKGERWHHHSAQKAAGEDQWITDDPEAEGTVICERLELGFYSRYPQRLEAMGEEHQSPTVARHTFAFIAHHDPETVLALYDALDEARSGEKDAEIRRLREENEELRQENRSHRAWLVEGFLREVHDPKKGPMTLDDARKYLRKLADDALAHPDTTTTEREAQRPEEAGEEGHD